MASLSTWLWGTSQLDEAIDKATSELIPSGTEDVALNLEICDQIRSKSAPAKDAMRALKRRLNHKNPNVQLLALGLTDVCVKNGGDHFLNEVASREFIDNLVSILKVPGLNHAVKSDILKYIQNWSLAFEGKPSLSYVGQVYKTLKSEGYDFPPKDLALANTAMVDTSTAPEWIDSDVCLRCRTPFTFTNRKHHCRNCGQVFDQQCSSKTMPLPHFGITQAVRVCDGCHSKLSRKAERSDKGHRHAASMYSPRHSSARDLADAELQRAIQLSLEEVGARGQKRPGYVPYQPSSWQPSEPPIVDRTTHPNTSKSVPGPVEEEDDPDLRAAIEASLREANMPKPSAPLHLPPVEDASSYSYSNAVRSQSYPPTVTPTPVASVPKLPNYDLEPLESDAILTFSQTVDQVYSQGGRDISRYPAVNELFDKANGLRPKLAMNLDDTGRKEQLLSEMHDKLSQAVKLYDKLLTDQLSNPAWRRSSSQQPSATQSALGPNGYTQWTPSAPVEQFSPPQSHFPQVSQAPQIPHSPVAQAAYQSQYTPYSHIPHAYTPLPPSQPSHSYTVPEFPHQPTSPTSLQSIQPSPLVSIPQTVATPQPPPSTLTSHLQSQPQPLPQASQPQPQPQQPPPLVSSTTLSRSHTVSSHTITSPPLPASNLARSSTLSHSSPTATRYQPAQALHGARYHPVSAEAQRPAPLPQFPTVPTSNPQAFDLHAPSVPTGLPVQERREELLIDL
ncbi:hypothetical protein F5I97DRAFT_1898369 [Phlebopus sp. FC_14]|nr:hypothetical protein F5I97DRAFT_1898369 [Phlebopus sp. FC_14]